MATLDWSKYPNFTPDEFRCKETGELDMKPEFMDRIQTLRYKLNFPLVVNSGYRSRKHSAERKKATIGPHVQGLAADFRCDGPTAYKIMKAAFELEFTGIGVSQKGDSRFVHLDLVPRESVWSY